MQAIRTKFIYPLLLVNALTNLLVLLTWSWGHTAQGNQLCVYNGSYPAHVECPLGQTEEENLDGQLSGTQPEN
jgi:hypothetical protein